MENNVPVNAPANANIGSPQVGRGLPRQFHDFQDDPFFRESRMFRDPLASHKISDRFSGSNPRLFDDDVHLDGFHADSYATEPSLFRSSLPHRPSQFDKVQRVGRTVEHPIHLQKQNAQAASAGPSHHTRQSSSSSNYEGNVQRPIPVVQQTKQQTNDGNSFNNFVEINNANPNSYTNGQLNPDKQRRNATPSESERDLSATSKPRKVPIVMDNNNTMTNDEHDSTDSSMHSPAISEQAIPLPPPASMVQIAASEGDNKNNGIKVAEKTVDGLKEDKGGRTLISITGCNERLIQLLDESERRVEQLRETASQLEQEKELILEALNSVKFNAEILKLTQEEHDELKITVDRIFKRCQAVEINCHTPRNAEQSRALDEVNQLIGTVTTKMQEDLEAAKEKVQLYLNACSPEEPDGPIDQKFANKIVECTADDQKKIRLRLAQIIKQIERAKSTCTISMLSVSLGGSG